MGNVVFAACNVWRYTIFVSWSQSSWCTITIELINWGPLLSRVILSWGMPYWPHGISALGYICPRANGPRRYIPQLDLPRGISGRDILSPGHITPKAYWSRGTWALGHICPGHIPLGISPRGILPRGTSPRGISPRGIWFLTKLTSKTWC